MGLELTDDIDSEYLLNGIRNGFKIIDSDFLQGKMHQNNYRSTAGDNKLKVEKRILEEIVKENYVIVDKKPLVTSALGAVPKGPADIRLIHHLSRPRGSDGNRPGYDNR